MEAEEEAAGRLAASGAESGTSGSFDPVAACVPPIQQQLQTVRRRRKRRLVRVRVVVMVMDPKGSGGGSAEAASGRD